VDIEAAPKEKEAEGSNPKLFVISVVGLDGRKWRCFVEQSHVGHTAKAAEKFEAAFRAGKERKQAGSFISIEPRGSNLALSVHTAEDVYHPLILAAISQTDEQRNGEIVLGLRKELLDIKAMFEQLKARVDAADNARYLDFSSFGGTDAKLDHVFIASTNHDTQHDVRGCRIGITPPSGHIGGWNALTGAPDPQWLMVDLSELRVLASLQIAGRSDANAFVTRFRLETSVDNKQWNAIDSEFVGNADNQSVVTHSPIKGLAPGTRVRYVKLVITAYTGYRALRWNLIFR